MTPLIFMKKLTSLFMILDRKLVSLIDSIKIKQVHFQPVNYQKYSIMDKLSP